MKRNLKLYFSIILLITAVSASLYSFDRENSGAGKGVLIGGETTPDKYNNAVSAYEKKDYSSAEKQFKDVAKKYKGTKWEIYARIYMARCWNKTGHFKKSLEELTSIIKESETVGKAAVETALEEIGQICELEALDELKNFVKMSAVKDVRRKAACVIGQVAKKIDPKEIKRHIEFMIEALKSEEEMEVAMEISDAIYKIGEVNSDKIIRMYKSADNFLKKKIIYLMSKYDDEDLIMVLQEESEKFSLGGIRNYISWALAKMDPYRFAKSYEGKLKLVDGSYVVFGKGFKMELFKPSLKKEKNAELEGLINKEVMVYGIETENGIIYTDIFEQK